MLHINATVGHAAYMQRCVLDAIVVFRTNIKIFAFIKMFAGLKRIVYVATESNMSYMWTMYQR